MRVLHIQKVKGVGGSERHLLSLLPGLTAAGDDVRLLVLAPDEEEERFLRAARTAGIDLAVIPIGRDANPAVARRIAREIRRFRPDLVHTHLIHGDLWGQLAARWCEVPAVRSCHNAGTYYRREPYRSAGRLAGRLAQRTIAISRYVAAYAQRTGLAPSGRIRVVPYGIDPSGWTASSEERDGARERFEVPEGAVVFGMAARLVPGKGHALALSAFAEAAADAGPPSLRLLVAGDGPLAGALGARASQIPATAARLVGHVEDVRGFFAACDVLIFPTLPELGEGFGLAALEAMAAARPVIATRVGALPEVIEDGVTGWVVEPEQSPLAGAIRVAASGTERREAMGAAARMRAASEFSLGSMVSRTRDVYREALG